MTTQTFRRPFELVYQALPQYPPEEVELAIAAALHGKRKNVTLEQMIAAVSSACEAQRNADLQSLLAQAQEQGRMTKSLKDYQAAAERERQERRAQDTENLRRFKLRLSAWIDRRIAACEHRLQITKAA